MNNPFAGELPNPFTNGKIVGENIKPETYHQENCARGQPELVMGRGNLMDFFRCPHRWLKGWKNKPSEAKVWGDIMDCKVLSPQQFRDRFAVKPAKYPAEGGQMKDWHGGSTWCKQWMADHADKQLVNADTDAESNAAVKELMENAEAREFIECSARQVMVTAEYKDKETGLLIPVKTLIDLVPDPEHPKFGKDLADFKTSADAHPFPWGRNVNNYGYHIQGVFYTDVWSAAMPETKDTFRHIISESEFPYEPALRILSQEFMDKGREKYLDALQLYCQCLKTGTWPNYEMEGPGRLIINGWLLVSPENWM